MQRLRVATRLRQQRRLRHRRTHRVQAATHDERTLESACHHTVAVDERCGTENLGRGDGGEHQHRRPGRRRQQRDQRVEPLGRLSRRDRLGQSQIRAARQLTDASRPTDLGIGQVAADRGDVQPDQRLPGRVADQARAVLREPLRLRHRAGRTGDHASGGVVGQVAGAADRVTHQRHRQPRALHRGARAGRPDRRLGAALGAAAAHRGVPAQPLARLTRGLHVVGDAGQRRERLERVTTGAGDRRADVVGHDGSVRAALPGPGGTTVAA